MDKRSLIAKLPPYQDKWVTVKNDHNVKDIITDILKKHKQFAPYYDCIALSFDRNTIDKICNDLYQFCKENIKYKEEKEDNQTTAIPTGILLRGYGDCKHYASFIGGVLDSIDRLTGKQIDWHYRFVSYNALNSTPHHVFIVVNDGDDEIWIDPTPGADKLYPSWIEDRYVKKSKPMPLHSNIGSVQKVGTFLEEVVDNPEVKQAASQLITSVTNLFTNLVNSFVIGDQVPNYPIKSKNTYSKIITQIQGQFPPPNTIDEARAQLPKAIEARDIAHTKAIQKGSVDNPYAVDETYAMIYQEVINTLQAAIAKYDAAVKTGSTNHGGLPLPTSNSKTLMYVGLGVAAFVLLKPKRKTSGMGSIDNTTLLLLGVGGFILFKAFNGGGNVDQKRKDIDALFISEGGGPIAYDMTDQEVLDSWELIFYYTPNNIQVPEPMATRLRAISVKYNIFT